jgi:hypothetical protein
MTPRTPIAVAVLAMTTLHIDRPYALQRPQPETTIQIGGIFMQLTQRGGPVTNKGRVRGLLSAWGAFFDRDARG